MSEPSLAVVIAAHDAATTLPAQLEALAGQTVDVPTEIVVVDNRSTDDTAAVALTGGDPRVRVVRADDGIGAGYARNRGVAATEATWIVFCDADDVVGDGWLVAMTDALAEHAFVTGPLDPEHLNPAWLAGSRGGLGDGQPTFEGIFPVASSCNLAIHRALFDAHGGFDESFRIGQDSELSLRLWRAGVALHYEPRARVHYRYRSTMGGVFAQARSFGRAQVAIERRLASADLPPRRAVRRLAWLLRSLPRTYRRDHRARWCYVCGTVFGRAEGRLRDRSPVSSAANAR